MWTTRIGGGEAGGTRCRCVQTGRINCGIHPGAAVQAVPIASDEYASSATTATSSTPKPEKGWPDKLDALAEHERKWARSHLEHAQSVARELVLIRSARTLIAIEQYRRANAERMPENWSELSHIQAPLVDPFSGLPLKILVGGNRYVVYSVGANRRDDGGNVISPVWQVGQPFTPAPDVGIAVTLN